jgi:hypothetical protein
MNMQKEDTLSPTVAVKSLFISTVTLDARESPDEGNCIPGAFMQADMVGDVHVKLWLNLPIY